MILTDPKKESKSIMTKIIKKTPTGACSYIESDERTGAVTAERDFPGIFPVYYTVTDTGCFCGYSIRSVLKSSGIRREIDPDALGLYLTFSCLPGNRTFFKNVKKLMPGCILTYKGKELSIKQVYNFDTKKKISGINKTSTETAVRLSVEDAIRKCHANAAFLSSGIDSSILTRLGNVSDTYTIDYDEAQFSEANAAEAFSKAIGANHHRLNISYKDYFESIPECSLHLEQPVGDCSYPVYYLLCKMAAKNNRVIFSGEGSDELFFGYLLSDYLKFGWYEKFPIAIRKKLPELFGGLHPTLNRFLKFHDGDPFDGYRGPVTVYTDIEKKELLKDYHGENALRELLYELNDGISDLPVEERIYYFNIREWLEADILTGAVKLSSAAGLDVLMPFLDRNVINIANTIPVKYQLHGSETKHMLREAFKDILPDHIVHAKKKGFPVPVAAWMKNPDVISDIRAVLNCPEAEQYFNKEMVSNMLDRFISFPDDNWLWRKIWLLYSFVVWVKSASLHLSSE